MFRFSRNLRLVQKLFTIMDSIMSEFEEFDADGIKWRYRVRDGVALLTGAEGVSESMTIPPSLGGYPVTKITDGAFEFCLGLRSVAIPDSVTSIGRYAFFLHGNLESISVDVNNPKYCSRNGLLLSKNGKTLIMGRGGEVTIPAGVTSIGDCAFSNCKRLNSVTIPNSVKRIGCSVFAWGVGLHWHFPQGSGYAKNWLKTDILC